ncbi:DNA polymerase III subunit beta [Thiohalorhabdus denitrificans]|uniref:Nucleotidyltransferase domain-containing protein n=1 Tax=Thiohalorhabdus denitrificans TaxID=381306 RepID=A0A0N8PML3_9GAMM|nr:nucleotidyltransferase domain-containing protein [Thiohalorhabdus denitrificans]KPV39045.1 DNA polymerase III subunit beta [Thiohalorhabdus denitrificans]SCX79099.1 Nucleotidyltransferase domain-containing protein [Thiohalorhabdus denitrificans]
MRLTEQQRQTIREEVANTFGPNASVRLFGSRLDDERRGGDIDLYIEADSTPEELLGQELKLYARLQRRLGERRIDIVVHGQGRPLRPIDRHARESGVAL